MVEVTEAVLVTRGEPAVEALITPGELGVTTAVDDVGTGSSSPAHPTRMPVHLPELDGSPTTAPAGGAGRVIVEAVVRTTEALGIDVVAEGVQEEALVEHARLGGRADSHL